MTGYYKNEKATSEMIDKKGWMHTGDLGVIDKAGNIFIKGKKQKHDTWLFRQKYLS